MRGETLGSFTIGKQKFFMSNQPMSIQSASQISSPKVSETPESLELGVAGLPPRHCDLRDGGMYALKANTASARYPLFASVLLRAIEAGRKCFLVTDSRPAEFLARLDAHWALSAEGLIESGQLVVFFPQEEITKKIFRYGADRFVQELESFNISTNSLFIFDQTDELLSLHDAGLAQQQVDVLGKWFERQGVTALLSFSRPSERQTDTFNGLMDYFTGIVRLGGDKDGLELTFTYWRASEGVTVARNFSLTLNEDRQYQAVESLSRQNRLRSTNQSDTSAPSIEDRRENSQSGQNSTGSLTGNVATALVFYNDPVLDKLFLESQIVAIRISGINEILESSLGDQSVLVLLNTSNVKEFRQILQIAHFLRSRIGKKLKLLIYGVFDSPHAPQSHWLLRAGANLVLDAKVIEDSFSSVVMNLERQVFIRSLETNFEIFWQSYQDSLTPAAPPKQSIESLNPEKPNESVVVPSSVKKTIQKRARRSEIAESIDKVTE
jgi:hypothetical protein